MHDRYFDHSSKEDFIESYWDLLINLSDDQISLVYDMFLNGYLQDRQDVREFLKPYIRDNRILSIFVVND